MGIDGSDGWVIWQFSYHFMSRNLSLHWGTYCGMRLLVSCSQQVLLSQAPTYLVIPLGYPVRSSHWVIPFVQPIGSSHWAIPFVRPIWSFHWITPFETELNSAEPWLCLTQVFIRKIEANCLQIQRKYRRKKKSKGMRWLSWRILHSKTVLVCGFKRKDSCKNVVILLSEKEPSVEQ